MIQKKHGKSIDIAKFKKPVLSDVKGHLNKIATIVDYLSNNENAIEQKECYICGGSEREKFAEIHGFTYMTCLGCSHVYTSTRYSDDAIIRFYKKNSYWSEVTYANKETCYYRRDNVAKPKVNFLEQYIDERSSGVWLDIGSGIGDLVSVVKEKGYEAIGLELSDVSVKFAKDVFGIDLIQNTIEEFIQTNNDKKGKIKVVSMIGLLEHVVAPIEVLKNVNSLLIKDGIVMIQVPNANSLASLVQQVFPDNVFRHMSPIEHIMLFKERSLNKALELTGFQPISYWFHGLDIYELITNLILLNDHVNGSPLYKALIENMNQLQAVIDEVELSDRIICIAKKK
ncbi:methionine biosynthesis protein MetW-like protein [Leptospira kirschneri str. 2008720114]|uniref:class I SAM-dependent methyltransferase n=1 Tax=Leptospira kirschneri TaxID=29507 RepID=UPI0002980061|nr:class I SAM-dependent methyltransferase [Leptospira kirschneri]EKP04868.1 methionine biosynthesis protein MetW-like protein [Leptospira kirschneri str. 2008720114]